MTNLFLTYLGISATVGIVVLLILLASPFINRRYAAKWKYYIWIFLAIRLLIPLSGMYHAKSQSPVIGDPAQSSGTVVYEPEEVQEVRSRRFVVEIPVGTAGQSVPTPETTAGRPELSLLDMVIAAWIAGAAIFVSVPIISCLHYKFRITHSGERIESGSTFDTLCELKSQLKIRRNVSLMRYPKAASPMIIGFIKPVMVLPCDEYSEEDIRFIVRHELIHLKRGDVYVKLLCVFANALHWFNPLIWIMRREMTVDMELSCDEGVIKGADINIKKAYTETLLSSLRRQSSKRSSLTTQFYGGKGTMKKRFTNILGKGGKKNGIAVLIIAVVLATLLGVLVGCTQKVSIPSDNELADMINNYLEFESICTYTNLPVDFDNPPSDDPSSEEHWIYPVTKEGMTTWEDWLSYLGGIFTESETEKALEKTATRYINYNGNLYYSDGGMGWQLAREYSIAKTVSNGDKAFTVELWREYDPDFFGNSEREFLITTLSFEYTSAGWRIADYTDRDSTPDDVNPNLAGYNPYAVEDDPSDNEAVTTLSDDEMNRLIAEYLRFERYTVYGCMSFTSNDQDSGVWIGDTFVPEIELDGSYLPSSEEGLTTWQEWLDFLNGLFTPETTGEKLEKLTGEGKRYMNVDGKLYVLPGGDMGWSYSSPVQAAYKANGSEGIIEFWREDFSEGCEWCYYITVLQIRLTDSGWRVQSADSYDADLFEEGVRDYEPLLDKPYSIDKSSYTVNKIYRQLMYDYQEAVYILTYSATEDAYVMNGVDQIGNLREIDGETYIPMVEYYDTPEEIKRQLSLAFTKQKCDKLYKQYFEDNSRLKVIDGRFYCPLADVVYTPFKTPFESAVQISDTEILAKTVIEYDDENVPCEVTFKYEDDKWKIDKLVEYMSEEGRERSY